MSLLSNNSTLELGTQWAKHPGNTMNKLSNDTMMELRRMYDVGRKDKKHRVSADSAHSSLNSVLLSHDWNQELNTTVAKIKAFFQMKPGKMKSMIENNEEIPASAVEDAELSQVESERNANALVLVDIPSSSVDET